MSLLTNILKLAKENIAVTISGGIVTLVLMFGSYIFGIFEVGYKTSQFEKFKVVVDSVMTEKLSDKKEMEKFVMQILASEKVKEYTREASIETQKSVIEMTSGDSINLRKELRLYMDLRESERVSEEIGRMYKELKRFNYKVDSILINHYSLRRRSVNDISL